MLPTLPSSIVAVAYTTIITALAGVQFRRSRTPLRLGSFVMAFFGLSIAALSVVYAADKMEMSIFWVYQFIAECIAVTWVITTIIHLGYAFYPLTRHQTLIWRVALGSVILYDVVAITELSYYVYAVWGTGILSKSSTPVVWVYWVRQVVKVIACVVTILYLFVPLVRHHHSTGVAHIADSNTLAVGAWYLGALGFISMGYSIMLIYYICNPASAFTPQAQSLDLCLRLLVCPVFSMPPPGCLLRYFHDKYGSVVALDTENRNTMVEDGIANDLCSRRPPMLVSQPGSFISNHLHRHNSDYMLESPTLSSQFQYPHQSSSHPSPQPHRLSLHQQHMQQQHLQKQHRYSISDYVPAFALKDSKLGAVHLDAYHQQQHQSSSDDEHRVGGRSRGTGPSSIDDSVAGSTALSMSGDLPHNASEVRLTPTTITIPLEDNNSSDMVAPIPQDDTSVDETMEATKQEEDRNKSIKRDRRPSLRRLPSSPPLLTLHHQRLQQEQEQQQQEQGPQDATVISLSIPEPLVSPTMTTPSEPPAAIFSFSEGYTSTPVVDPKHEEAKQTAQAARRISRRLTMEGRREGMDLMHISSLIKWNNPRADNSYPTGTTAAGSHSRDRLHETGWPRSTTAGSSSSLSGSRPTTPLREYIPHKISSFFSINKSSIHPNAMSTHHHDSTALTEQKGEEEEEEKEIISTTCLTATEVVPRDSQSHDSQSSRGRQSSETNDTGHSYSPTMTARTILTTATGTTTTTVEPAHSRDRLRRSQSLTRATSSLSPPSQSATLPDTPSTIPQQPRQNASDRVPNCKATDSPVLLSIPTTRSIDTKEEPKEMTEKNSGDALSPISSAVAGPTLPAVRE